MKDEENSLISFLDRCTESWLCPECAAKDITARVKLYQANCEEAIYFCETRECVYPYVDDYVPVVVNRSLLEIPVDGETIEKFGFSADFIEEGALNFKSLYKLSLIKDAFDQVDSWNQLEKTIQNLEALVCEHSKHNKGLENISFNTQCTPLKELMEIPEDLIEIVKLFIPNVEKVVELLKLGVL